MTTFLDDCINSYRNGDRMPFDEAYLTITLCCTGSLVPDELKVCWSHVGDSATERIRDDKKVIELLRLFIEHEERIAARAAGHEDGPFGGPQTL